MLYYLNSILLLFILCLDFVCDNPTILFKINTMIRTIKTNVVNITTRTAYHLIYTFSICQIQLNKVFNVLTPIINPFIKFVKKNNSFKHNCIILGENDDISKSLWLDSIHFETIERYYDPKIHNGIIVFDSPDDHNCKNMIYYKTIPKIFEYKKLPFHFIMVELIYDGHNYLMELKNDYYNYYIVNNYLNIHFVKYYITNVLKLQITPNFDYTIIIIDQNFNNIKLFPYQELIFDEKCEYKIINENNMDTDDTDDTYVKL